MKIEIGQYWTGISYDGKDPITQNSAVREIVSVEHINGTISYYTYTAHLKTPMNIKYPFTEPIQSFLEENVSMTDKQVAAYKLMNQL